MGTLVGRKKAGINSINHVHLSWFGTILLEVSNEILFREIVTLHQMQERGCVKYMICIVKGSPPHTLTPFSGAKHTGMRFYLLFH